MAAGRRRRQQAVGGSSAQLNSLTAGIVPFTLCLQLPPMPEELREWAQDTLSAAMAGVLFGGGKTWLDERQAGASLPAFLLVAGQGSSGDMATALELPPPGALAAVRSGRCTRAHQCSAEAPLSPCALPCCRPGTGAARCTHQAARGAGDCRGEHSGGWPGRSAAAMQLAQSRWLLSFCNLLTIAPAHPGSAPCFRCACSAAAPLACGSLRCSRRSISQGPPSPHGLSGPPTLLQRLSRIANGAVRGGLHFGGLAAVFYAVQVRRPSYRVVDGRCG